MPGSHDDDLTPPDRPRGHEHSSASADDDDSEPRSIEHVTGEIRILRESAVTWQRLLLIIGGAATVIVGGSYAVATAAVDGGVGAMQAELSAHSRGDAVQQKATQDRLDYLKEAALDAKDSATAAKKAAEQSREKLVDVDAKLDVILRALKKQPQRPQE